MLSMLVIAKQLRLTLQQIHRFRSVSQTDMGSGGAIKRCCKRRVHGMVTFIACATIILDVVVALLDAVYDPTAGCWSDLPKGPSQVRPLKREGPSTQAVLDCMIRQALKSSDDALLRRLVAAQQAARPGPPVGVPAPPPAHRPAHRVAF